MKKEEDNSFGVAAVVIGILSIVSGSLPGIVLGVIGVIFSKKQNKIMANKWSKSGFLLGVIGIILGIALFIASFYLLSKNPGLFSQLG